MSTYVNGEYIDRLPDGVYDIQTEFAGAWAQGVPNGEDMARCLRGARVNGVKIRCVVETTTGRVFSPTIGGWDEMIEA